MNIEPKESEEVWIERERQKVLDYLESQRCEHAGVGEWPAFHVDPYVALWAIQSISHPGRIGWWAISGDLPTDYMNSDSGYHPRDALRHFSAEWLSVAEHMRRGVEHPRTKIGRPELWPTMAPILEQRSDILKDYADRDDFWEDQ